MRKARVVRDPVHGYLTIAAHETIVIDHPITQRLRRINQTGLAELVFPEARTSRLAHSFGAMHLASQFLMASIENADEEDALAFLAEIDKLALIDKFMVTDQDVDKFLHVSTYAGSGLLSGRLVFRSSKLRSSEFHYRALLGIVEAALRLAALFHDLGHLPFSHDFEFALRDYIGRNIREKSDPLQILRPGQLPPHETIGHILAKIVLSTLVEEAQPTTFERAAFKLAVEILDHEERYDEVPSPNVSALGWLHSVIDGEIDVDRADYLLRDGRALGLEFADYDLARLVNNIKLARHPELGYITAVREQGLIAVESFYLSRSRSSQVLVRHHKVAQIGVALRHATTEVLVKGAANHLLDALRLVIAGETDPDSGRSALKSFGVIDDCWWIQTLKSITDESDPVLTGTLRLALWREPTLNSIWKRKGDLTPEQKKSLNAAAKRATDEFSQFEEARNRLLRDKQTLLALHRFRPYGIQAGLGLTKSVALVSTTKGGMVAAAEMSPLMLALCTSWEEEVHLHAFCLRSRSIGVDEVVSYLQQNT